MRFRILAVCLLIVVGFACVTVIIHYERSVGEKLDAPFTVSIWLDIQNSPLPPTIEVGKVVPIKYRAEEDCYMSLFYTSPAGKTSRLFPLRWLEDNFVRRGETYTIEPSQVNRLIKGSVGMASIKAVGTKLRKSIPARQLKRGKAMWAQDEYKFILKPVPDKADEN